MTKPDADLRKVWELIKNIEIAMLTTQSSDGSLTSRPMATQRVEFDGELWFFTEASSHKVDDVNQHSNVNVCYSDSEKNRFISVSGKARIVRDKSKALALWQPFLRAWFQGGVDDPEVALLKVTVERVEYWESASSKVVRIFDILQSVVGRESLQISGQGSITLKS
jgi:general stress protein 26